MKIWPFIWNENIGTMNILGELDRKQKGVIPVIWFAEFCSGTISIEIRMGVLLTS